MSGRHSLTRQYVPEDKIIRTNTLMDEHVNSADSAATSAPSAPVIRNDNLTLSGNSSQANQDPQMSGRHSLTRQYVPEDKIIRTNTLMDEHVNSADSAATSAPVIRNDNLNLSGNSSQANQDPQLITGCNNGAAGNKPGQQGN